MMTRLTLLIVTLLALASGTTALAQDDPADAVEAKIRKMYRDMAQGDFQAGIGDNVLIGSTGYLPDGLLKETVDAETLATVVAMYSQAYEEGMRIMLTPTNISVRGNDRGAIATFLVEGMLKDSDDAETTNVMIRASHVWLNIEGQWKLAHFHYSHLALPPDDEDDDDEDDDDDDDDDDDNDDEDDDDDDDEDEDEDE